MMLTHKDKEMILDAFKNVDVKKLQLDYPDKEYVKWFRFGSHIGIDIASQIVKSFPERKSRVKKIEVRVS